MRYLVLTFLILITHYGFSQSVGIGNNNPDISSILEITSDSLGVLIPRMSETEKGEIINPAEGLMVYQISPTKGFFYFNDGVWHQIGKGGNEWIKNGDELTTISEQVAIGLDEVHPSAALQIESDVKGILIPRLSQIDRVNMDNPAQGLLVYQFNYEYGFYFYSGTIWHKIGIDGSGDENFQYGSPFNNCANHDLVSNGDIIVDSSACISHIFPESYDPNSNITKYVYGYSSNEYLGFKVTVTFLDIHSSDTLSFQGWGGIQVINNQFADTTFITKGDYLIIKFKSGATLGGEGFFIRVDKIFPNYEANLNASEEPITYSWKYYPERFAVRGGSDLNIDYNDIGMLSASYGYNNLAQGPYSSSFGYFNRSEGPSSNSFGRFTKAKGYTSSSFGLGTEAIGESSTSLGQGTKSIGLQSLATGYSTNSNGTNSSSFGSFSNSNGSNSSSFGVFSNANGYASTVIGMYNDSLITRQTSSTSLTPLFIIGNGTNESRSNAMVVRKDGKIGIGTNIPDVRLNIKGGLEAALSDATGNLVLGDKDSINLVFDNNEIQARNNGSFSNLKLQENGGKIGIGNITPTALLHLKGIDGTNSRHIRLESNNSTETTSIYSGTNFTIENSSSAGDFIFRNGATGTNVMNVSPDGNLDIGGSLEVNSNTSILGLSALVPLNITGGIDANVTGDSSGYILIGYATGENIVIDNNEIMARNNGAVDVLSLQNSGGKTFIGDNIEVDGALEGAVKLLDNIATIPSNQSGSYTLSIGNKSFIRINNQNDLPSTLVQDVELTNGEAIGHLLTIIFHPSSVDPIIFIDNTANNIALAGDFTMSGNKTLTLIWNGSNWAEVARGNN